MGYLSHLKEIVLCAADEGPAVSARLGTLLREIKKVARDSFAGQVNPPSTDWQAWVVEDMLHTIWSGEPFPGGKAPRRPRSDTRSIVDKSGTPELGRDRETLRAHSSQELGLAGSEYRRWLREPDYSSLATSSTSESNGSSRRRSRKEIVKGTPGNRLRARGASNGKIMCNTHMERRHTRQTATYLPANPALCRLAPQLVITANQFAENKSVSDDHEALSTAHHLETATTLTPTRDDDKGPSVPSISDPGLELFWNLDEVCFYG
ncbi:uncharacterized protein PAC_17684 [Phialocephala subalpina]|uniref:Uncharacterized protein n=1 Tax=Phialocephala subalpina TaxID=576137 RepID=A0A1L7XS06_9HELO|nr:uncharacterized protein PAC_17684 [Phialocephala subalpina]